VDEYESQNLMVSESLSHTLFPPISEEGSDGTSDVLSSELRSNFKQLRALLSLQEKQQSVGQLGEHDNYSANDEKKTKKRKKNQEGKNNKICNRSISSEDILNSSDHIMSQRVHLAARTLVTAQNEIALLYNGISELEALLASNEENSCADISEDNIETDGVENVVTCDIDGTSVSQNHYTPNHDTA
jgi:hypothetical protein